MKLFFSIKTKTYCFFVCLAVTLFTYNLKADANTVSEDDSDEIYQTIENYKATIKQLEIDHGVYHAGIGENLLSIGIAFSTLKHHAAALEYYQRALQNHRINYGLHTEEQIPIVKNLIDTNFALNDWEALNKNYDYLNWLYRRVYGHNSEDLITPLETLAQAKLKLYYHLRKDADLEQLRSTEVLFNKVVELSEGKKGYVKNKLNALYGISLANYQVASFISSERSLIDVRDVRKTNSNYEEALRHDMLFNQAYKKGKDALEQIVKEHQDAPELSKESEAMALTYLGDWYLLFNHNFKAKSTYTEANNILVKTNSKDLFSKPVQLPIFTMPFIERTTAIDLDEDDFFTVSMDITKSGQPRNIEFSDNRLDDKKRLQRSIKNILSDTRFRPRFENGQAVLTKNFMVNYIYPQSGTTE